MIEAAHSFILLSYTLTEPVVSDPSTANHEPDNYPPLEGRSL